MPNPNIHEHPIHLGLGATASAEPTFTGDMSWYMDYAQRHASDGPEGRLVAMHSFDSSWDVWEMHPRGSEVVLCLEGTITLIQDVGGTHRQTTLGKGEYAINPPGVWHTADVDGPVTVLFITAGEGTENRARWLVAVVPWLVATMGTAPENPHATCSCRPPRVPVPRPRRGAHHRLQPGASVQCCRSAARRQP